MSVLHADVSFTKIESLFILKIKLSFLEPDSLLSSELNFCLERKNRL